jgi:hypothetical protein
MVAIYHPSDATAVHLPARTLIAGATILFGALPATLLAGFIFFGVLFGLAGFFDGERLVGGLMFGSSILGIVGTYGLWRVALVPTTRRTAIYLALGLLGLIGANVVFQPENTLGALTLFKAWLLVAPGLVALCHLGGLLLRKR